MIVGLTGGIGSGKTTVSEYLACHHHIDVIDADKIARQIVNKDNQLGQATLQRLVAALGEWVVDDEGNYNRTVIRQKIFEQPALVNQLNAIIHPMIRQQILTELIQVQSPYAVLDVPLLFEGKDNPNGLLKLCQAVMVVDVPMDVQIARASARDGVNGANIEAIIKRQIDRLQRLDIAERNHYDIIDNSKDLKSLYNQIDELHKKYSQLAQASSASALSKR